MIRICTFGLSIFAFVSSANAETVAEFYKGKVVDLYISTSSGGGYDTIGRILARHIGKHIPGNPTVVPRNMPGGGGIRLGNYLYSAAPKDGTTIGIFNRGVPFSPLAGTKGANFDPRKFNWIGSTSNEISLCIAWHTSGVTRWEDVLTRELIVGSTGQSADNFQFPTVANALLGTRFKMVTGYPGGSDIDLALERGEVQGRCGWSWTSINSTRRHWVEAKRLNILFQMAHDKHPDLPNVPLITDLAKSPEDRAILRIMFARQVTAWPFTAPPDVPKDRVDALRKAFLDTMVDPEFLASADKGNFEIIPVSGVRMHELMEEVYTTPPAIVERFRKILK
jgi:tripartite-type tricarboxylate transporter receptor subunit TctC